MTRNFVDAKSGELLTVSVTFGSDASKQLSFDSGITPTAVSDLVTGTTVYTWIDPQTDQRALAWAAQSDVVVWIYGVQMTPGQLAAVAPTVRYELTP
ncbi:MAG: hypothetical protein ABIQ39_11625 [Ilumatobacteraceae bacterium]